MEKCKKCAGLMVDFIREWQGESEKWKGGRWRCVDICEKCGHKEYYNLDGM